MNPDFSPDPRQEREARLSALILGQLPEDQAAELQQQLQQDPELLKLYHRLQSATELIREAAATADPAKSRGPVPRLSHQRRERLLASFKTITPDAPTGSQWSFKSWLVPAAAAAMILVLAAGLLPGLSRAKSRAQQVTMLAGRRLASLESEQVSVSRNGIADDLSLVSPKSPPLESPALAVRELRSEVRQGVELPRGEALSAGTGAGGFGGRGTPAQIPAKVEAAPPQALGVVGYVNVDASPSLPSVNFAIPAPRPAAMESAGYGEAMFYKAKPEANAQDQKKTIPVFDSEVARDRLRLITHGIATGNLTAGAWADYNNDDYANLKFGDDLIATGSRKLAEFEVRVVVVIVIGPSACG